MARASQIAVISDLRLAKPKTERSSIFCLLFSVFCSLFSVFCLLCPVFCLGGCAEPQESTPIWEKVKIGDLAPYDGGKKPNLQAIKTINLEVLAFEVPSDNIEKLDKIRKTFYIKPLRLQDYGSFTSDSFLVRFGQSERWREIQDLLLAAGGQRLADVSLMLANAVPETIAIVGLDRPQSVFFTATDGSKQAANIGPGILGLRIQAETIPGSRGQASVISYPVFSPPTTRSVPELNARAKLREFPFTTVAFGLNMEPGDFVYLGPKEYVSDRTTLGGLFFSDPRGRLFFSETKAPEFKRAVRVFLILCTGLHY
jgi:hypothetical protein